MIDWVSGIWPMAGLDFNLIKRINLGILVAAITLVILRRPLVEAGRRKLFSILLGVLSLFAVVNYANYFSFHGEQTFIHWHDVTHYYLGSKYSDELGYEHLYTAMLRAEAEIYDDHFVALEARDLKTNSLVDIRQLLRDSDAVKERFDPERWGDFKLDVELLHQELGPHWASVLRDHGYNPTPVWTILVSQLTGRIPAGSRLGIELLALLDPLILLLLLVVIARTFGLEAATWVVVYFCVIFGATFGWTGGALLRYLWFLGIVGGFCALRTGRYSFAGGAVALAVGLRIFPVLLVVPMAIKLVVALTRDRQLAREQIRFWTSFGVVLLAIALGSLTAPRGTDAWSSFQQRIATQIDTVSPNVVGLTTVLTLRAEPRLVSAVEFRYLAEQRAAVHRAQLWTVFPLALFWVGLLSVRTPDEQCIVLGIPLILLSLNLAGYYFIFLILLVLVNWSSASRMCAILATEAIPYLLLLFTEREALLFAAWSLALIVLMLVLYGSPLIRFIRKLDHWCIQTFR